jgi:hypothetical protein
MSELHDLKRQLLLEPHDLSLRVRLCTALNRTDKYYEAVDIATHPEIVHPLYNRAISATPDLSESQIDEISSALHRYGYLDGYLDEDPVEELPHITFNNSDLHSTKRWGSRDTLYFDIEFLFNSYNAMTTLRVSPGPQDFAAASKIFYLADRSDTRFHDIIKRKATIKQINHCEEFPLNNKNYHVTTKDRLFVFSAAVQLSNYLSQINWPEGSKDE